MESPKPKTPMIANRGQTAKNFIKITTASLDARQWLEQYGPSVGNMLPSGTWKYGVIAVYHLWVSDVFDADEVCAYINSMAEQFT